MTNPQVSTWLIEAIADKVETITGQRVTGGRKYGNIYALDFAADVAPFNPVLLAGLINANRMVWSGKKMIVEIVE